jgi:hypothetical protein
LSNIDIYYSCSPDAFAENHHQNIAASFVNVAENNGNENGNVSQAGALVNRSDPYQNDDIEGRLYLCAFGQTFNLYLYENFFMSTPTPAEWWI